MPCNGKPFALEILEFSDVRSSEFHPGSRMMGCQIYYFLSRVKNMSVKTEDLFFKK
ncbi:hypothetical protein LPB90_09360 [Chryseobacterium sp. LC2016-29]|uniref:hypothetical protein n=1 Tax=Chryseobacterium sp. LC2016-29 TaxID=2897331 RepID=UPI001E3BB712|nr:hypothetical protein [Chryseobacterium sp. LC2016-29]MCD0478666.1 hypothetical protein [Chryseobacterium sp. LC2016-29]